MNNLYFEIYKTYAKEPSYTFKGESDPSGEESSSIMVLPCIWTEVLSFASFRSLKPASKITPIGGYEHEYRLMLDDKEADFQKVARDVYSLARSCKLLYFLTKRERILLVAATWTRMNLIKHQNKGSELINSPENTRFMNSPDKSLYPISNKPNKFYLNLLEDKPHFLLQDNLHLSIINNPEPLKLHYRSINYWIENLSVFEDKLSDSRDNSDRPNNARRLL